MRSTLLRRHRSLLALVLRLTPVALSRVAALPRAGVVLALLLRAAVLSAYIYNKYSREGDMHRRL